MQLPFHTYVISLLYSFLIGQSLFGGPLVDRTTNRIGALIFQSLVVLGQALLALGGQLQKYWLMILVCSFHLKL